MIRDHPRVRGEYLKNAYRKKISKTRKPGPKTWYDIWVEGGLLEYYDKEKTDAWATSHGLQLPTTLLSKAGLSIKNIKTKDDLVKRRGARILLSSDYSSYLIWNRHFKVPVKLILTVAGLFFCRNLGLG